MRLNSLISFFFIAFSFGFKTQDAYVIEPGKGTKDFRIGHFANALENKLGKHESFRQKVIDYNIGEEWIDYFEYPTLGITVMSRKPNDADKPLRASKIYNLYFEFPALATTIDSFELGRNTRDEVFAAHGRPDGDEGDYYGLTIMNYRHLGVSYTIDDSNNKIVGIEVYAKHGKPEMY